MRSPIQPQDKQQYLFSRDPEEWIPSDHPVRFLRCFVDSLDLMELGFHEPTGREGGVYYLPETLLKIWLYGYYEKIIFTRELERACRSRIDLIWLTGNLAPDHNTLWRFLKEYREGIKKVFIKSVQIARTSGILGLKLHGLDGTKIKSACSRATGLHREDLEKALKEIEEDVKNYIEEAEEEHDSESPSCRLPEHLSDAEKLKDEIKESLAMLDEVDRDHYHPGEPDARMMKATGRKEFCYNAQLVVDMESGVIVASDVSNEESDNNLLVPMVKQAQENTGETCEETVADGGYQSSKQFNDAEEEGLEVQVYLKECHEKDEEHKYDSCNFDYDRETDELICPLGKRLTFERIKRNRSRKTEVRVYRCRHAKECPERWKCSKDKRGRAVELVKYHEALRRQREKNRDPAKKNNFKLRFEFVERKIAHIKQHMNFRRWTMHDLAGVKTQWRMLCTAANLKTLYKLWREGILILDKPPPKHELCAKLNPIKT